MAKKIEKSDFFTKAVCILIAVLMWVYVVYTEKPDDEVWLRDIPVMLINSQELKAKDLIVLSGEEQKLDIRIKGRKNVISSVRPNDVVAKADLSTIDSAGTLYPETTVTVNVDGVSVVSKKNVGSALVIDNIIEKKLDIDYQLSGTAKDAAVVSVKNVIPSVVKVKGPSKIVEELSATTEPLLVDGLSEAGSITKGIVLKDAKDNIVDNKSVELELSSVTLEYEVTSKKNVEVKVNTTGTNRDYDVAIERVTPSQIEIYGEYGKVADLGAVYTKPIDISDMKENCIREVEVPLSDGLKTSDGKNTVEVIFKVTAKTPPEATLSPVQGTEENDQNQ